MTNHERADQLLAEAAQVAEQMRGALQQRWWNLAVRRAQEVIELVVKGLLNEMGVEYPRTHDAAPVLVETIQRRQMAADSSFLEWLQGISRRMAEVRGPAFYHEIEVRETEARAAVDSADRVLGFGQDLLRRLRGKG